MNAHDPDRAHLVAAVQDIEARYPLRVLGRLPRGAAARVFGEDALDLLAKKRKGLSLLTLAGAEIDLAERFERLIERLG